ncbi:MAG: winged helix-turn-helix domain-containing protein [Thermoproteota archaeon]|nr:winged helix-turn-helix domain-containing protein [Thermoproteota archaeon]
MKYRSRIDTINDILEAANGGNATRMKIMYKALLGYKQLKENLILLTEHDLLRYDKDTQTFRTTEKGMRFLKLYNQIGDMIKKEEEQQPSQPSRRTWMHRQ